MPNIKPVSDLRNFNEVLIDVVEGEPVFLSRRDYVKLLFNEEEND